MLSLSNGSNFSSLKVDLKRNIHLLIIINIQLAFIVRITSHNTGIKWPGMYKLMLNAMLYFVVNDKDH